MDTRKCMSQPAKELTKQAVDVAKAFMNLPCGERNIFAASIARRCRDWDAAATLGLDRPPSVLSLFPEVLDEAIERSKADSLTLLARASSR